MPQMFLYQPFANYKEDAVLEKCMEYFQRTGMVCTLIEPGIGTPLAVVGDDDLLMIDGHGDINTPGTLYLCKADGLDEPLTANDLAAQLLQKGLKKTHQSILMLPCFAGGTSSIKAGAAPGTGGVLAAANLIAKNNKKNECFSSVLGRAMGLAGYFSILVGGFPGVFTKISYSLNGVTAFQADDGTRVRAQLDHIQWFDCKGAPT